MPLRKKLVDIVGSDWVLDDPETLEVYSGDESFVPPVRPQCIVKPSKAEEVIEVVKLANETGTPLVPMSSGPPHFRGDTVPSIGGSVVLDLSRMKRVVRVDPKNKVALIEPGVTFSELILALRKEGLAPYMPLVPRSTKSVIASYLEREPITIPKDHWETQDPLLCTEVVYGSGDLFRTGSAAGPGTLEEQWVVGRAQIRGLGPTQADFTKLLQAAQGTMGVVTWATVKCRRLPKVSHGFLVPSENLRTLIDLVYKLLWLRLGEHFVILNSHNLACIISDRDDGIKDLRDRLPKWILLFNVEGAGLMPEEKLEWQVTAFKKEAQEYGLEPMSVCAGLSSDRVVEILSAPSPEPYWKLKYRGGCYDIFFYTTLNETVQLVERFFSMAGKFLYSMTDIGVYLQPTVQGTNCHCEFNLYYSPRNNKEVDRIKALDQEACPVLANMGAFFSRPYGSWAKLAFRDSATVNALRKLKSIFDPNNIMNPGKLCF